MGRLSGTRFAAVPLWLLDAGVSDRAIRLYAVLQSYVSDETGRAWPSRSTLADRCACSTDSIDRAVKELTAAKALRVDRRWTSETSDDGHVKRSWTSSFYFIALDNPVLADPPLADLQDEPLAAPTRPPSRTGAASPSRTGAAQELEPLEQEQLNQRKTRAPLGLVSAFEIGSDEDPEFATFWRAYPRKVDKGAARRAWRAAVKKQAPAEIAAAAARFAADPNLPTETGFVPHPATWLNGERWNDGPLPPRRGQPRIETVDDRKAAIAAAAREAFRRERAE